MPVAEKSSAASHLLFINRATGFYPQKGRLHVCMQTGIFAEGLKPNVLQRNHRAETNTLTSPRSA